MADGDVDGMATLDRFRSYLQLVAEARFDRRLRGKVGASDVVQQTLLQAHQALRQFQGRTDGERIAWLQAILTRNLLHCVRDYQRSKRDVSRERSLDAICDQSSARLEAWLASDQASPSHLAVKADEALRLADAVEALPSGQREAVILYYWQSCTLAEIGEQLGRSTSAAGGLLRRGLENLRRSLPDLQSL
jgi:RNA polymerase sigma-70 factor, ECF subfamily